MAAAGSNRGGRNLSSLFNEDSGPMKRRKVAGEVGGMKLASGALCFYCGLDTKKTSELAWL